MFFFSSRRRHTRCGRDWSSDVCSSDLRVPVAEQRDSLDRIMSSLDPQRNLVRKIGVLGVAVDSTVAASMSGLRIRSGVLVVAQALDAGGTQTGLAAGDGIQTTNRTPIGTR